MTATEVRIALDRLKSMLTAEEFSKRSHDEKAYLCQMIHAGCDEVDIALTVQSLERPLTATIKGRRQMYGGRRQFFLHGVPVKQGFQSREAAVTFANEKGITLI